MFQFLGSASKSYYDTDNGRDYDDYYEDGQNYESRSKNTNYNYKNDYNSRNNYRDQRNDYEVDYDSSNHYRNQSQRQRNVKNYKEDDNSQGRKYNNEHVYGTNKVQVSSKNRYLNFFYDIF